MKPIKQKPIRHSQEPWSVGTNEVLTIYAYPDRVSQDIVAGLESGNDYDLANAERIVDCVNAFEGIEEASNTMTLVRVTLANARDGAHPDLKNVVKRLCALLAVK